MKKYFLSLLGSFSFTLWSLRRRTWQIAPVSISILLLIGAVQSIGSLQDISSHLVGQQITRAWRGQYDLLVRPQTAVSETERRAGWIDPQSILETYGGISQRQVASIETIAHVEQVVAVATVGWQPVKALLPIELAQKGLYRISVLWQGQQNKQENVDVRYVEVSDLAHLTHEAPLPGLDVQHVVMREGGGPVVFTMSVQGIQALMGVPASQKQKVSQVVLANLTPAPILPLSLRVDYLRGDLSSLARCVDRPNCWEARLLRPTTLSYQDDGVQLLRYSRTQYVASSQQIATGQIAISAAGIDTQGTIYRALLPEHFVAPILLDNIVLGRDEQRAFLSFSMPQRWPLLTSAVRFMPLEQACAINGERCYSALFVRLSGVERYSQRSQAILQSIAASIVSRTGLHVDILDGSSLRSLKVTVRLPSNSETITGMQSMWRVVGVAVQIEHGLDALQVALLVLCTVVCLLAIASSGVLVGIGRMNDALLLRQMGWQHSMLIAAFTIDGLALCGPGCLLAIGWTILSGKWTNSLLPEVTWALLAVSVLLYCSVLMLAACSMRRYSSSQGHYSKTMIKIMSGGALASAVFLIAEGYLLIRGFNNELMVTVLGKQVQMALESSQLALLLIFLSASLLTVGLCIRLLLLGRREELQLLAMIGWERRSVIWRIAGEYCAPALVSGVIGVMLAMAVAIMVQANPTTFMLLSLLVCGPLLGALMSSAVTIGNAWSETRKVYRER